jgi:ribonuclease R
VRTCAGVGAVGALCSALPHKVEYKRKGMALYPERAQILEALAHASPLSLDDLMRVFAVAPAKRKGFERLLDNLVFEGGIEGGDDGSFSAVTVKVKQEAPASRRAKSLPPPKSTRSGKSDDGPKSRNDPYRKQPGKQAAKKGLPDSIGAAPKRVSEVASASKPERAKPAQGGEQEGTLSVNARGFGFVAIAGQDDVFIGGEGLGNAMHGDKVRIRITRRSERGFEGVVTEVVSRGRVRVSGILKRRGKSAWLEPDDTRIRGPIVLKTAMDAQGPEGNSGVDGDVCIVQVTRYPEHPGENPEGKLLQVLGRPGVLSVEAQKLVSVAGIEETHSDEAITESEAFGPEVPKAMLAGREDLTHVPLPTIDPEDARDHDDAVWVERHAGGFRAWIAIADVSSYVTPGTKLDEEARTRGCSVYLPDRAIPMLPRALSSNLCSLLPDVVRLCLCVIADLDAKGTLTSFRVVRGFMKSQAKLTYGGVARALGYTELPPKEPKAEAMVNDLKVAAELSRLLRGKRMDRGALDFDLPEPKILWGDNKEPVDVTKRSQDGGVKKAYQLIEELMLLGNEVVAQWLTQKEIPAIFRVHLPPDEKKLEKLAAMCTILGLEFDISETRDAKSLSALVKRFNSHEKAHILHMLLLRSMKQAVYEPENRGHFGLASTAYLHFTSPIRRYPDLVVHRAVHREALREKPIKSEKALEALAEAAVLASQAERRAMEVERDVVDLYRCFVMKDRVGTVYAGNVTSLVGSGAYVALEFCEDGTTPAPFVDVMLRFDSMGTEALALDDDGLRASASSGLQISIGDKVRVRIAEVVMERRQILGQWLDAPTGTAHATKKGRGDRARGPGASGAGNADRGRAGAGGRRGDGKRRDQKGRTAEQRDRANPGRPSAGGGSDRDPKAKALKRLKKLERNSRKNKRKAR